MKRLLTIAILLISTLTLSAQAVVSISTPWYKGLLGPHEPGFFLTCWFFACLGVFVSINLQANKRNIDSTKSPKNFSYLFLLMDNWPRLVVNAVIMFLALRFYSEISGRELTEFKGLLAGLSFDQIVLYFKKLKRKKP